MSFPHIKLVNFDGILREVAVMKEDPANGDLYFIRIDYLDNIDRTRLRQLLSRRDAAKYPLWDLLDQQTLPNGVNALEYFHQYVKVRSASGKIFAPSLGRMGAPVARQEQQKKVGRPPKSETRDTEQK